MVGRSGMNVAEMFDGVVQQVDKLSNGNPVIAGVMSLWLLGVGTYIFRQVPLKIYGFFMKHMTTELTTTSQNEVFHNLLSWLEEKGYSAKFRKVKLSNGKFGWGSDKGTTKSVGYGSHLVWFMGHPVLISLNKEESHSEHDKETISLHKIGRSHAIFDRLIREIGTKDDDKDKTKVHKYSKGGWEFVGSQPKRVLSSVIIEKDKEDALTRTIDEFVASEDWFVMHGIPYQLGILLYGPPGTGKTSLIKAIAAYADRPLCIARLNAMSSSLEEMLLTSPDNSIVVIEDIDTSGSTKRRKTKKAKPANEPPDAPQSQVEAIEEALQDYSSASLSDILNAIDGVVSRHGRILVMTTNYPEKIDEALLRPGRVDLKLEIGYMDAILLEAMLRKFFDDIPEDYFHGYVLGHDTLTGSMVQGDIREKKGYKEIADMYRREA